MQNYGPIRLSAFSLRWIRVLGFCFVATLQASEPELVDVQAAEPTILTDLRYAGVNNIAQRPLYPVGMRAMVAPGVAAQLKAAQNSLRKQGYGLKIWDAYRPKAAQDELWRLFPNDDYIANASNGLGSMHRWGVAVDATLVDLSGAEVTMPTDFDNFTPAAMLHYTGTDPLVRSHLHILQRAMGRAGFLGMRTEWWHFVAQDWSRYLRAGGARHHIVVQAQGSRLRSPAVISTP